jgi:uncharacterized membrane protein YkoI
MSLKRIAPAAALCLALAGAAGPAAAAHADGHRGRESGERTLAERAVSLDDAVAQAERRYKARAVRAEEKRHGDRVEYRIRLLGEDGRVFEIRVDAATGREV